MTWDKIYIYIYIYLHFLRTEIQNNFHWAEIKLSASQAIYRSSKEHSIPWLANYWWLYHLVYAPMVTVRSLLSSFSSASLLEEHLWLHLEPMYVIYFVIYLQMVIQSIILDKGEGDTPWAYMHSFCSPLHRWWCVENRRRVNTERELILGVQWSLPKVFKSTYVC